MLFPRFRRKRLFSVLSKHYRTVRSRSFFKKLVLFFEKLKKAFTLVELLVVIAIIALLTTLSVVAFNNARAKARDARRLNDVKTMTAALEMYYSDFGSYPAAPIPTGTPITNLCFSNLGITSTCGTIVYSGKLPSDPIAGHSYDYTPLENGGSYTIAFALESKAANHEAGSYQATPTGIVAVSSTPTNWTCGADTITDANNNIYDTVQIGNQCWMKKNLNVGTRIDGIVRQGDYANGIQKYCYSDNEANCNTDGGLYQWHMATGKNQACNDFDCATYPNDTCCTAPTQGICPSGWHIPSFVELQTLAQIADPGCDPRIGSCYTSGTKLESTSWEGSDDYGFTALPSGGLFYYDQYGVTSYYFGQGSYTLFWLSTPYISDQLMAFGGYIYGGDSHLYGDGAIRANGYSVRCIKD